METKTMIRTLLTVGVILSSPVALAGRGGSTVGIEAAVASGSVDAIVSEIERSEGLACLSCIEPVRQLVDHDSAKVRDVAGWWLGKRGVRDEVIADMKARLLALDPVAARNAADVLGAMRDFSTLSALTTYIAHPLDEESGQAAARAIGNIGHPSALAALEGAFASPLAGVRASALEAIRNLRAPKGASVISDASKVVVLLADTDVNVRRQAAYTAGFLRDRNAVPQLMTVVTTDASALVRKGAAWALGQIGDGRAIPSLTQALTDADALVRSIASGALGRLK
jgi:HEAT repeat protein